MSSIHDDLASFHEFATARLAGSEPTQSLDELFLEWADRRDREQINASIRRGLADVDAGRHGPAGQAMEAIRNEFGFGP